MARARSSLEFGFTNRRRTQQRPAPFRFSQKQPPRSVESIELGEVEDEFSSRCECLNISMERMTGSWVPSLASNGIVEQVNQLVATVFRQEDILLNCTKIEC